ncbi:MAG: hypothetical protein U1F43_35800 [Myxococcota bacterium]
MLTPRTFIALVVASTLPLGASARPAAPDPVPQPDARSVAALRAAAAAYRTWGRVDERPNIAPDLCRAPTRYDYGQAAAIRLSTATGSPHGTKLYYLWTDQRGAYLRLSAPKPPGAAGTDAADLPVGTTIVKESFVPKPAPRDADAPPRTYRLMGVPDPIDVVVTESGERLTPDRPSDLFIMTKLGDASTAGTDRGWIYGTVAPDGTVTSAGRVERCMGCHDVAPHDRLFGLAR